MNITLVSLHAHRSPQAVPLACAFLKETLLADRALAGLVRVEIAEFFQEDDPDACADRILKSAPDLVAFSVYLWNSDQALAVAREIALRAPSAILCAGGPEPTANPAGLLDTGVFRFLVRGEGEGPFLQAIRLLTGGKEPAGVPGILLPGEVPGPLPMPMELDNIPSPYLSGGLDPAVGATDSRRRRVASRRRRLF